MFFTLYSAQLLTYINIKMKKLIFILAIGGLTLASCKKERTCECTVTTTSGGQSQTATGTETYNDTKKNAKEKCEENESETTSNGSTTKVECELV